MYDYQGLPLYRCYYVPVPSKIVQFQSMPDGSLVALDSNGSLWQGRVDHGYSSQQQGLAGWLYGQQSQLSNIAAQQNQAQYVPGTGKLKWTKISE